MTAQTDQVAMAMAQAFHWADRHLDQMLANPVIASDQLAAAGCGITSIVLRPFATELALKALYLQETSGEPRHVHDLKALFESLEPATQKAVEQRFERIRQAKIEKGIYSGETDPLLQVLTRHKDDFEQWRYLHEQIGFGMSTQPTVLNSVIEAVLEEYASRAGR